VRRGAALAVGLAVALSGCSGSGGSDGEQGRTTLTVLAAASLTEAFTALEKTYEAAHPDVDVKLSFDSSAILVEQLSQGLEADVLATADTRTMDKAASEGLVTGTPTTFATNTLVIVTPKGNPAGVTGLDDLAGTTFAVCVPAAPCGDAATRLFALDGFTSKPATVE
jgi:molybdate transport system substrate-binding protein